MEKLTNIAEDTIWYCKKNGEHYKVLGAVSVKILNQRTTMVLYIPVRTNDHCKYYSKSVSLFKQEFTLSGSVQHLDSVELSNNASIEARKHIKGLLDQLIILDQHKWLDHLLIDNYSETKKLKSLLTLQELR